jgi:hypothetical protein
MGLAKPQEARFMKLQCSRGSYHQKFCWPLPFFLAHGGHDVSGGPVFSIFETKEWRVTTMA